ncbi:aldo/keto reductase, partial [archaeon]|nr:aldo/keto reductase [archaeon]
MRKDWYSRTGLSWYDRYAELYDKMDGAYVDYGMIADRIAEELPLGGKVLDSATGYRGGASEALIGDLTSELGNRDRLFFATKVNARSKSAGLGQINQSFRRLRTDRIDLIAVHNLSDTATQLETLRETKQAGRIRYLGIT